MLIFITGGLQIRQNEGCPLGNRLNTSWFFDRFYSKQLSVIRAIIYLMSIIRSYNIMVNFIKIIHFSNILFYFIKIFCFKFFFIIPIRIILVIYG